MTLDSQPSLARMFRYNAWANARVFAVCRELSSERLTAPAPGTHGTIEDTLKHLVGVEEAFRLMVLGQSVGTPDSRDAYFAQDLAWFLDRGTQLGAEYPALVAQLDDAALAREIPVPWLDFRPTALDGLLQVLSHSAQHRAQIFAVLGSQGMEVPCLDYIMMARPGG
jgi:uncharacterized damage-inducible protein DinB